VVGGILLPVILVLMLVLVNDRRLMGRWVNSRRQNVVAWATTWAMIVLTVVYLVVAVLGALGVISA
jgi:Mn2+/Fe2+ NRAMP family transporter